MSTESAEDVDSVSAPIRPGPDVRALTEAIHRDGVVGLPQHLRPEWADQLRADFDAAFAAALAQPGGTISRGPQRHYFAVHPERIRGFLTLVADPVLVALFTSVLGPDYRIVELAFDVPLPGAVDQPWHRDFPMPSETEHHRRLSSLAVNATTVDVTPELAPFEIAPGTQWDRGPEFAHGMFPGGPDSERYASLATRRYPKRGDVSVRTGLTVHRGTANHSDRARGMLILGVVAPDVVTDVHGLVATRSYLDQVPGEVRRHLDVTAVDELLPLDQKHDIEGLVMGQSDDPPDRFLTGGKQ